MNILCVLTDPLSRTELRRLDKRLKGDDVSLLAFTRAGAGVRQLERLLGGRPASWLDTRRLMQEAIPLVREQVVQFCAEWPTRPLRGQKGFKELFVHEGLSLWWLCELSQKNTEARPTFWSLCELEALRLALARSPYDEVVLLVRDRDLADVFRQLCTRVRVKVVRGLRTRRRWREGLAVLLLGRIKDFLVGIVSSLAARTITRQGERSLPLAAPGAPQPQVAFLTWYPSQWAMWRGALHDRYYVHLPDEIRATTGWGTAYVGSVPNERVGVIMRDWMAVRRLITHRPTACPWYLLEAFAGVWDVCRLYAALRIVLRYLRLELCDRVFRASFGYRDLNIFPIARYDLRISFIRQIPLFLLLAHRVKRCVQVIQPAWLVMTLETYCVGRAIAWGVRASGAATKVVGYQHSPVNANMLFYRYRPDEVDADHALRGLDGRFRMPLPDLLILHGMYAKRMLERSGVPASRLRVCGCPRFDDLMRYRDQRINHRSILRARLGLPGHLNIVLVAGVLWPACTSELIRMCAEACAGRDDLLLVFKPHPLHPHARRAIEGPGMAGRVPRWWYSTDHLNLLQAVADVMVTANSTADVEAIAIGCPVIRVKLTDLDSSPSMEVPGATVDVESPQQLTEALEHLLQGTVSSAAWPDLIEGVFYRLDGMASKRFIDALRDEGVLRCRP
jgi:surface carbohydrate biosynthesis protein (TIGR04326 family)